MSYEIKCSGCDQPSFSLLDFRCPSCGQPLEVNVHASFETNRILRKDRSLWRYRKYFPYVKEDEIVTLGEGWTPTLKLTENVHLKLENLNPTGSFKDRGSAILLSGVGRLIQTAKGYLAEDSSGNAGASVAAYAARAGLKARIYVPENVSGPKFNQIRFYNADVVKVSGGRNKVAEQAQKAEKGKIYVGHILHPLFRDGIRTLAYEVAEQFSWKLRGRIYVPVSAGTLLLGMITGFKHLVDSEAIERMPMIVACQTRQVSPLCHSLKGLHYSPPEEITSMADALVSSKPPLLDLMVKRMKQVEGDAVMVEENEIRDSFFELAAKGFFVEPSSAVAYAAYKKHVRDGELSPDANTVIVLTGTGLKVGLKPHNGYCKN